MPVLIPCDTIPVMDYLADTALRETLGLNSNVDDEGMHYMFANTGVPQKAVCYSNCKLCYSLCIEEK